MRCPATGVSKKPPWNSKSSGEAFLFMALVQVVKPANDSFRPGGDHGLKSKAVENRKASSVGALEALREVLRLLYWINASTDYPKKDGVSRR